MRRISEERSFPGLLFVGCMFIGGGINLIYYPDLIFPYLTGIFVILLGLVFIVMENKIVRLER